MASLSVNPQAQTRVDWPVFPPLVIRCRVRTDENTTSIYAMAMLLDSEKTPLEGGIYGTMAMGHEMTSRPGGSRSYTYFCFPELCIEYEGTYYVRILIFKGDLQGDTLEGQIDTEAFTAVDDEVPLQRPCMSKSNLEISQGCPS
jgi:hypothetical protein